MNTKSRGCISILAGAAILYAFSALYFAPQTGASNINNGMFITGGACTNQFVRSLNTLGVPVCNTVANTDLASPSITVNGTTCTLGSSCTPSGGISGVLYSQIVTVTDAGSGATTLIDATGAQGSITIASAILNTAGNVLHVYASGIYSSAITPGSLTLRVRLAATNVCSGAFTPVGGANTTPWILDIYITSRTPGVTGTLMCNALATFTNSSTLALGGPPLSDGGGAFDTTGTLAFDLTAQWNAVTGADSISATNIVLGQL